MGWTAFRLYSPHCAHCSARRRCSARVAIISSARARSASAASAAAFCFARFAADLLSGASAAAAAPA
jgi:hypothetical protein